MVELALLILVLLAYASICHIVGRLALDLCQIEPRVVLPGTGLLLGAALLAVQLWVYGVLRIAWMAPTLLLPWILLALARRGPAAALFKADLRSLQRLPRLVANLGHLPILLLAISLALGVAFAILLLERPLRSWDAIAMWLYKAKVFYVAQSVDLGSPALQPVQDPLINRNLDYPPLFSLMVATLYTLAGQVQDSLGKAVNLVFLGAGAAACFAFFRVRLGPTLASLLCLLLLAIPAFQPYVASGRYFGIADLALGIWIMLAMAHLLLVGEGWTRAGVVAVALAAGAALTKVEGIPFLVIVLLATGFPLALRWLQDPRWRESLRLDRSLTLPAAMLLAVLAWEFVLQLNAIKSQQIATIDNLRSAVRLVRTHAPTIANFFSSLGDRQADYPWIAPEIPWLLVALAICTALLAADRFRRVAIVYIVLLAQAAAYVAVYLLTPLDLYWLLVSSWDRLVIQLIPGLILLLGAGLSALPGLKAAG